tara:strand:+ start:671 stop:1747 length:1077 start_codon:yes stop_codon:yes gene_type:complete
MVKKSGKSSFTSSMGAKGKKAFEQHKTAEVEMGSGGGLPAGIENGIAQLTECKVGIYKKGQFEGEYFFTASGTVIEPTKLGKIPLKGLRTQLGPEPLCDTPSRKRSELADHMKWVLNELKKLGADVAEVGFEEIEDLMAALKEAAPYFRFRTWVGEKATSGKYKDREPMIQHEWAGMVDYDEDKEGGDEEDIEEVSEDESEEEEEDEAAEESSDDAEGDEEGEDEEDEEEAEGDEVDVDAIAVKADAEDEKAAAELAELATKAGLKEEFIENAASWAEVAEAIKSTTGDEGEKDDDEEEEAADPEKEDVVLYKVPKTRKATEHEVTFVSKKKKTVNLKDLNKGTIRKGISWDKLQAPE